MKNFSVIYNTASVTTKLFSHADFILDNTLAFLRLSLFKMVKLASALMFKFINDFLPTS